MYIRSASMSLLQKSDIKVTVLHLFLCFPLVRLRENEMTETIYGIHIYSVDVLSICCLG